MTTPISLSVVGLGAGVPERIVDNVELASQMDTSDEWIRARTGISTRRIQADDKALSDLGILAGRQALEMSGFEPESIDLVLVATMTPDTFMPATSCRIANALGCRRAGTFDLNIACSGFIYGLLTVAAQLGSSRIRRALCIGGDTLSRITNWQDRRTAVLFGDAAGAVVVTSEGDGMLLGWDYGADGRSFSSLVIKAGPSAPSSQEVDYKVEMDGKAVFRFAAATMVESSERALKMAGLTIADVDVIVPHQANQRILESAAKRWGISIEKFVLNLDRFGNTSAGSVPLALSEAVAGGRVPPGGVVLLSAFGGGLSWAAAVLRWPSDSTVETS